MKLYKFINFPKNKNWVYSIKNKNELIYVLDILEKLNYKWEGIFKIKRSEYYEDIIQDHKIYPITIFYKKENNNLQYGSNNFGFNNTRSGIFDNLNYELIK